MPQWRKILYEDQGFPDNYVDASFLEELKKNLHVRSYSYSTLVYASLSVTQQLSSVGLFVSLFFSMEDHSLSPQLLWLISSSITLAAYTIHQVFIRKEDKYKSLHQHLRTGLLFQGFSYSLSPVLVSLTETISTDTIYAMTVIMFTGYLLFYNYQGDDIDVPGAISLNAATFASVCLASRLHTAWHAFTAVTVSFEIFALWPLLQNSLKEHNSERYVYLTIVVSLICGLSLLQKTLVGAVLYLMAVLFVTFLCPGFMLFMQPLKNNIYGPWDEAIVNMSSDKM